MTLNKICFLHVLVNYSEMVMISVATETEIFSSLSFSKAYAKIMKSN